MIWHTHGNCSTQKILFFSFNRNVKDARQMRHCQEIGNVSEDAFVIAVALAIAVAVVVLPRILLLTAMLVAECRAQTS